MEKKRKIRVLIVDDSLLFQKIMTIGISADPDIEVVATAGDPYDARDKIIQYSPDVITCDVEMPRMNGIEFIRQLLPQYTVPVIMVSGLNGIVFDALSSGAVDFVAKPQIGTAEEVSGFINHMIEKIKIASVSNVRKFTNVKTEKIEEKRIDSGKVIAIGASTGGTEAIKHIIPKMPQNTPGIVVVQHIPPDFSRMFAERLNDMTQLHVKEAENGDRLSMGTVLVAPGDRHMCLESDSRGYYVTCTEQEKVNGHRPSVDVLFDSVAKTAGRKAVGVILTGMGKDGAKGLLNMKRHGAMTVGQNEATSIVYGMPRCAMEMGAVDYQVPLDEIAEKIYHCLEKGK